MMLQLDIMAILPELILFFGAMGLLMVGVFSSSNLSRPISLSSIILLLVAAIVVLSQSEEAQFAFNGALLMNDFTALMKALTFLAVAASLVLAHDFMHLEEGIFHRDLSQSTRPVVHAIEAYLYESASTLGPGATAPKGLAHYISEAIVRELKTEEFGTRNRMRMRLTQVWEEVNANPGADWKLPVLAKRMHVSVRQFQRIMKENYDLTAEGLLMRIRMEHARELLSSTDMTMMMVADRIGYQCVFAFSKGFKRHFGTPPPIIKRPEPLD